MSQVLFGARQPEVIAHRGVRTLADMRNIAPENTLPAFQQAAGLDTSIELDVIATRDGHLVVHHDDKTGRVFKRAKGNKLVQELDWEDVKGLALNSEGHEKTVNKMLGQKSGYHLPEKYRELNAPELGDVLDAVWRQNPNTHFYVELKTYNRDVHSGRNNQLELRVADLLREKNLYDRVTVISFSPASLEKIKKIDPKIQTGWDWKSMGILSKQPWLLNRLIQYAEKLKVDLILPAYSNATAQLVQMAHNAGLKVAPYVKKETREQEEALFPKFADMGVDGIVTNAVDQLQSFLQRKPSVQP